MKVNIARSSNDPFSLGAMADRFAEFDPPVFNSDKTAWETKLLLTGPQSTHEISIYGASALQSLMLATQFVLRLYEPEMIGTETP